MKKTGFVFLLFVMATGARAQEYKNAIGIRFSSSDAVVNHSVTFKHFLKEQLAIEALASFVKPYAVGVLVEKYQPLTTTTFTWFWGAGAYAGFAEGKNFGAQGILGLDLKIPQAPVNLSLDWKPELNIVKEVFFEPAAIGVSARFTF